MRYLILVTAFACSAVSASPINITCNGSGLDGRGRVATAGIMTLGFEFDPQAQTMFITQGAPERKQLRSVVITDGLASGTDGEWIYEINRIDGTATLRPPPDSEAGRKGLLGDFYRGNCTVRGTAKF
jgi:hypothetical protein